MSEASYHYLRFAVTPACQDALTIRKMLQDALLQSFGLTSANTYMDILSLAEDGTDVVIRLRPRCVQLISYAYFNTHPAETRFPDPVSFSCTVFVLIVFAVCSSDTSKVTAAVTAFTGSPNLSLLGSSGFLPALLAIHQL